MSANGFALAAQYRKAMALCSLIPTGQTQDAIDRTASFFEKLGDAYWCELAKVAGIKPPSKEPADRGVSADVRRIVLESLRKRQPMRSAS